MFCRTLAATGMLTFAVAFSSPAAAEPQGTVHAIVNVDLMPSDQDVGMHLLTDFVADMRRDPTVSAVTLIQQDEGANHFILMESFASPGSYRRFIQAGYVRRFRKALFAHLGSPWDERLGHEVGVRGTN